MDGKTIVGNNEDWISPNSQFWFEKGGEDQYDALYVGLLDKFAQGAMNTAGLVFDGFANDYLPVNDTEGKLSIPISEAIQQIMQTMSTVNEVKTYLSTINLSILASGQLVFVDRSGDYLIVEGDEMILGSEPEQCFSNFYYSQIESIEEVELENVKNGLDFIRNQASEATLDYAAEVMKSMQSVRNQTQYTTVYDLNELVVRVYLFHDYSTYREFSLEEMISSGEDSVMLVDLFPNTSPGYENFKVYNDPEEPNKYLKNLVGDSELSEAELEEQGFSWLVNTIGYEWLLDKKEPKGAIQIFKYGTELMPNNANLYDSLGEAYLVDNQLTRSQEAYERSLELNPDNEGTKAALKEIEKKLSGG